MSFEATDADAVRDALAALISSIVPRYAPRASERWTWVKDQEVAGTLRTFDVVMAPEEEYLPGAYGGGLTYASETEIRASYPLSEPDMRRFVGADGQDLAAILIRAHTTIAGVDPVSVRGGLPLFERVVAGGPGAYVVTFRVTLTFFVSDTVTTD